MVTGFGFAKAVGEQDRVPGCEADHQREEVGNDSAGGGRGSGEGAFGARRHAVTMDCSRTMGWPQQGQGRGGAGDFSAGAAGGGQPVAAAIFRRFALAAG